MNVPLDSSKGQEPNSFLFATTFEAQERSRGLLRSTLFDLRRAALDLL
jgi:hypothetical protein